MTTSRRTESTWGRLIGAEPEATVDSVGDFGNESTFSGLRRVPRSLAVGLPTDADLADLTVALRRTSPTTPTTDATVTDIDIEYRVGVGEMRGPLPLRVLGQAMLIAQAAATDAPPALRPTRMTLFSSSAKLFGAASRDDTAAAAILAIGLRTAGFRAPLHVTCSDPHPEIAVDPSEIAAVLPAALVRWVQDAGARSTAQVSPMRYAIEHSAATMFGDIDSAAASSTVRVTIGPAPEAKFWAVRAAVRQVSRSHGVRPVAALGLIMKSVRVPWYHPRIGEPALFEALASLDDATNAASTLTRMANPSRHGNGGLMPEAKAVTRLMRTPSSGDGDFWPAMQALRIAIKDRSALAEQLKALDITTSSSAQEALA